MFRRFQSERGVSSPEYALLSGMMAFAIILSSSSLYTPIENMAGSVRTTISAEDAQGDPDAMDNDGMSSQNGTEGNGEFHDQ